MKNEITLRILQGVTVPAAVADGMAGKEVVASLQAELNCVGYALSAELAEALCQAPFEAVTTLATEMVAWVRHATGSDASHRLMYPNFPAQVASASECELIWNALLHYASFGCWLPEYSELQREYRMERTDVKVLKLVSEDDFLGIFQTLIRSTDSLSPQNVAALQWFLENVEGLSFDVEIPYKETLCIVASHILRQGWLPDRMLTSATDVLRVATYLSDGDISLAEPTKFKSLPRKIRRLLVDALNAVITEDDIGRHPKKWIRLFHSLHIGEYRGPAVKIAGKLRSGKKCATYARSLDLALQQHDLDRVRRLLRSRPGDFARRLDHVLRLGDVVHGRAVVRDFQQVVSAVSTRVLVQLYGHFGSRDLREHRIVIPKGRLARPYRLPVPDAVHVMDTEVLEVLSAELKRRFAELPALGRVFIDEQMWRCPIPSQQRSTSAGARTLSRGTRIPMDTAKTTLRMFVHWIGIDIDLSAALYDAAFNEQYHISFTNLRLPEFESYHSGDKTYAPAPDGATEMIDLTIDQLLASGLRYVSMNLYVYDGPTFKDHERCYVGWMLREFPDANAAFDPKTVEMKVDVVAETRHLIPVVFDLEDREAIWADFAGKRFNAKGPRCIERSAATSQEIMQMTTELYRTKMTLGELFSLHAEARGQRASDREDADTVIAFDGDVTPYDIERITTDFLS